MANNNPADESSERTPPARSKDEIALELTKFIAVTTGYGRGAPAAGFTGKATHSAEDYAQALLDLFERCRAVLNK